MISSKARFLGISLFLSIAGMSFTACSTGAGTSAQLPSLPLSALSVPPTQEAFTPFDVAATSVVNRIVGTVVTTSSGDLVEVSIYDSNFQRLTLPSPDGREVTSESREIPEPGPFEFAIPEVTLTPGRYYLGITTTSNTAEFSTDPRGGGQVAQISQGSFSSTAVALNYLTPTSFSSSNIQAAAEAPALIALRKSVPVPTGYSSDSAANPQYFVFGIDPSADRPIAIDTGVSPRRFATSAASGAAGSWTDLMVLPTPANSTNNDMQDLVVLNQRIYVLFHDGSVLRSSDLTSTATWQDISPPSTLRHSNSLGRPQGMTVFNGKLYWSEYSAATGTEPAGTVYREFANGPDDGPFVLKFDPVSGTWTKSFTVVGARHVHTLYTPGDSHLWMAVGDAGTAGIGIWRLTQGNIGQGPGGTDLWEKWTSLDAPHAKNYPVGLVELQNVRGAPNGLYGGSDRPGKYILYSKTSGNPGQFNLSAQMFQPPRLATGNEGETVGQIINDQYNNLYFWTQEGTQTNFYVSPAPYTQIVKLDIPASRYLPGTQKIPFQGRAVRSGDYIMMYNQRFHVVRFPGE
ncbi:hypothetical protein MF271_19230 (plasmid) [Deinococcus sp. KNUC1210]|uniref:hypothetical protein n=1 Tax=Deinococcus sp. KNUC1210 TaxID=2917691 RepID=UPI001EEFAA81|nr:hypothetical protein [Deinococcus sp. KNUC1210]ULH17453.1 hypothetical protein MF271_19230 [Deinococcus sp. KNUC1210]